MTMHGNLRLLAKEELALAIVDVALSALSLHSILTGLEVAIMLLKQKDKSGCFTCFGLERTPPAFHSMIARLL